MPYFIFQGDPDLSPPPGTNPALTVPKAENDREVYCLGSKMFGSSDVGTIGRRRQENLVGTRSNGRFGDVFRTEPSHMNTLVVPWDGTELDDLVFETLDQFTQDAVADLIFERRLIVTQDPDRTNTAAYIDPLTVRGL